MISPAPSIESFTADGQLEAALSPEHSAASEPQWLRSLRQRAWQHIKEHGLVDPRHEDWRFSRIGTLSDVQFSAPTTLASHDAVRVAEPVMDRWKITSASASLVLVDGIFEPLLSSMDGLPAGVSFESLAEAVRDSRHAGTFRNSLGRVASVTDSGFAALNTCWFQDGAFLHVERGVKLAQPIEIVHVTTGSQSSPASYPRHLFIVDDRAEVDIVETFVSTNATTSLTDAVSEFVVSRNATLRHYRIQDESRNGFFISASDATVDTEARFESSYVALGGDVSRNEVGARFVGEEADIHLTGLYQPDEAQHMECRTRLDHAVPNCRSDQVYKGILNGTASGVFNGRIHVHQDAQKTDAKQSNRALLLSDDASVQTQPQLEIYADDVKCTHGATVGHPDEASLFYLRSRGVPEDEARRLLTFGFANEAIERCNIPELRELIARNVSGDVVTELV